MITRSDPLPSIKIFPNKMDKQSNATTLGNGNFTIFLFTLFETLKSFMRSGPLTNHSLLNHLNFKMKNYQLRV